MNRSINATLNKNCIALEFRETTALYAGNLIKYSSSLPIFNLSEIFRYRLIPCITKRRRAPQKAQPGRFDPQLHGPLRNTSASSTWWRRFGRRIYTCIVLTDLRPRENPATVFIPRAQNSLTLSQWTRPLFVACVRITRFHQLRVIYATHISATECFTFLWQ